MEGTDNYCTLLTQATGEAKQLIEGFRVPKTCPIPGKDYCGQDVAVDISKHKGYISIIKGKIDLEANVEHNNGKSCYKAQMKLHK